MGRIWFWFKLVLICLTIAACAFRNPKDELDAKRAGLEPSFASISAKIFAKSCIDCHQPGNARGGLDLSTYAALMASNATIGNVVVPGNYLASSLYTEVASGAMPKPSSGLPRLSNAEVTVIAAWIQGGAPETGVVTLPSTPANPPPSDPPVPSPGDQPFLGRMDYRTLYAEVLEPHCKECHESPGAKENIDVTNYASLTQNPDWPDLVVPGNPEGSELYKSVKSGRMPRRRSIPPELRAEMLRKMEAWINQGALEEIAER